MARVKYYMYRASRATKQVYKGVCLLISINQRPDFQRNVTWNQVCVFARHNFDGSIEIVPAC